MSDPQYHVELVKETKETCGRLDIAVNNAGISHEFLPAGEIPLEVRGRVIHINHRGGRRTKGCKAGHAWLVPPSDALMPTSCAR